MQPKTVQAWEHSYVRTLLVAGGGGGGVSGRGCVSKRLRVRVVEYSNAFNGVLDNDARRWKHVPYC